MKPLHTYAINQWIFLNRYCQKSEEKKNRNVLTNSVGIFFRHCHHQIDLSRVFVVSYVIERQTKQVVNVCAHSASLDALFFRHTPSVCAQTQTRARTPCLRISMRPIQLCAAAQFISSQWFKQNGKFSAGKNIEKSVAHTPAALD